MYSNDRKHTSKLFASVVLSVLFAASSAVASGGDVERIDIGPIGKCTIETGDTTDTLVCQASALPDNETASIERVDLRGANDTGRVGEFGGGGTEVLEIVRDAYPVEIEAQVIYSVDGQRVEQRQTWTVDERPEDGGWSETIPASFDLVEVAFWPHKDITENWSEGTFGMKKSSSLRLQLDHEFGGQGLTEKVSFSTQLHASAGKKSLGSIAGEVIQVPVANDEGGNGSSLQVTIERERPESDGESETSSTIEGPGHFLIQPDSSLERVDFDTAKKRGVDSE